MINLDTFGDRENTTIIGVTPAGVRTDGIYNDVRGAITMDWNSF